MSRSLSLAFRIAQLISEYSETEISEAVRLIEEQNCSSKLLKYLSHRNIKNFDAPEAPPRKTRNKPSNAVLQLRDSDPDKFRLLSEFEVMVTQGKVLETHDAAKRFGERISKDFQPRKSRKETIRALLSTLTQMPLVEIEQHIRLACTSAEPSDGNGFQQLAEFIIKGKPA